MHRKQKQSIELACSPCLYLLQLAESLNKVKTVNTAQFQVSRGENKINWWRESQRRVRFKKIAPYSLNCNKGFASNRRLG